MKVRYPLHLWTQRFSSGGDNEEKFCAGIKPMHVTGKITVYPRLSFEEEQFLSL
jgi:hypothetical protein